MNITTKWDFSKHIKLFDEKSELAQCKRVEQEVKAFEKKYKGNTTFINTSAELRKSLDEYVALSESISQGGQYGFYYFLAQEKELNNAKLKKKTRFYQDFGLKIHNRIEFFTIRIAKTPMELQKVHLQSKELEGYKHFLENLYTLGAHLLSEESEKVDNLLFDNSYTEWVNLTNEMLSKKYKMLTVDGKRKRRNFSQLIEEITNREKSVRDSASEDVEQMLDSISDIAEHELNNVLRFKKIQDEIRGFMRPDASRHMEDDIDSETIDTLVSVVTKNFGISKRYYEFKAKMFGLKKLKYHERGLYYGNINKKFTYEQAASIVQKVFTNLDKEFGHISKDFFENSRIDVYPQDGKMDGGVCFGETRKTPIFILINYLGKVRDITTIAHELGHAINYTLMRKQPEIYYSNSMMTAEVASTFMEDFVLQELLSEVDDETRLAILMYKLDEEVGAIFRQIACYNFELELHKKYREKSYLSKREIGDVFIKNMGRYLGSAFDLRNGAEKWWIYWGHIRQFFYVYSYSSGLLISKYLQGKVKKDKSFILNMKKFLEAGSSKSPRDLFLDLGIDVHDKAFWKSGIDEVDALLDETVKLAKKLGKI